VGYYDCDSEECPCDPAEDADQRVADLVAWAAELADYGHDENEIINIMGLSHEKDETDDRREFWDWCRPQF